MPIGKDSVEKVFYLSRISLKQGESEKFSTQLAAVVDYMDKLSEVDTEHVEPVGNIADLSNVFREDVVQDSMDVSHVLQNAPAQDGESFKVPKVF